MKPKGKRRVRPKSRGTRNIRRQLQREVYMELGLSREKPTIAATNKEILALLHPTHKRRSVMYSVAHDFSALPAGSRPKFVDETKVKDALMQNPKIRQTVERYPRLKSEFDGLVERALAERGARVTAEIWRQVGAKAIKTVDSRAAGYSQRMNQRMGEAASQLVQGIASPKIFDIGTGTGETIKAVVKKMPAEQRARAKIVLSDVVTSALWSAKKELVSLGVKSENVIILPAGFNHIASALRAGPRQRFSGNRPGYRFNRRVLDLIGSIDLIVSGATLNNFPELGSVLRAAKRLLKKGGHIATWDWAGIETSARRLFKGKLGKKMFATEGLAPTGKENLLAFSQFWLNSYILDQKARETAFERLRQDVEGSNSFDFIKWAEENKGLFEQDWKKIAGKGRRNRAYRTTGQMATDMKAAGFRLEQVYFPLYNRNKITQGNTQYIMVAKKG